MRAARPIRPFPLVILSLVVLLASCRGGLRYPRSLTLADSLTECCPDSAIRYLDRLRPAMDGADEADRMYYRLLCVKAADKAYIPHTSDSLIRPVLDYYEQGGDARLLPVARYYAGRVSMDLGDAPQAISYFQKAIDIMDDSFVTNKGLCYSQMGYLQVQESFYDEALGSFQNALSCFISQSDTTRMLICLSDIGSVYNFMGERRKGLRVLLQAKGIIDKYHLPQLPEVNNQIARTYLFLEQPDSSLHYLSLALSHLTPGSEMTTYTIAATIYQHTQMRDSMLTYANKLLEGDLVNRRFAHRLRGDYYQQTGDVRSAMSEYQAWADINDTVDEISATRMVAQIHSLYNYQLRENENRRLQIENKTQRIVIAIAVIISGLLAIILLFFVNYQKKKRMVWKLKLEKYQRMVDDYMSKHQEQTSPALLMTESGVYKKLRTCVSKEKKMTDELSEELMEVFNRTYPEFYPHITELCKLSDLNYMICVLIKIGFNPTDIGILVCKSKQAITSARKRMYSKAFGKDAKPEKWDEIILSL